jgi:hypothetical protein
MSNAFANSAQIIVETVRSPSQVTILDLSDSRIVKPPNEIPKVAVISPTFKWVLITVLVITVGCGIGQFIAAGAWPTMTPNQQTAFDSITFGFKAGLGAIFGLLGGKIT